MSIKFPQSLQLDWASVGSAGLRFWVDALKQFSAISVHPLTIVVAEVLCRRFVIRADAQKRIQDALFSSTSSSYVEKLDWFGFRREPLKKLLAQRAHGQTCVALCACMSISYESFYVAEVLREFCKFRETPPDIIPSVHQWKALVHICAGSISNSKFPTLLEGLIRLVLPRSGVSFHQPTSAEALAKAIGALIDVSNDKLINVMIAGGPDCIWLAAILEWLLALDVEILLDSGSTVYRSSTNYDRCFPAVTIIFVSDNEQLIQTNTCHVVPKGHKLWGNSDLDQSRFRGGCSEWTNILADTFGTHLGRLLKGTIQHSFALLLFDASRLAEGVYRYGPMQRSTHPGSAEHSFPFRRFHFSHWSSRGQAFLEFAA